MPDPKDRWQIKNDKWEEKPGGGYRTKSKNNPPTTIPEINDWIMDMIDWGQMVIEDLTVVKAELRTLRAEVAQHTQALKEIDSLKSRVTPT